MCNAQSNKMTQFVLKLFVTITILSSNSIAFKLDLKIQSVTKPEIGVLESPQWSVTENALYYVNNVGQKLFRMDGITGEVTTRAVFLGRPYFIVPVRDHPGYVVVAIRTSIYLLKWGAPGGDSALRLMTTVDSGRPDNNISDGKADAAGRLWFGTSGKLDLNLQHLVPLDKATLYSMDQSNFIQPVVKKRPVSISNGIAWSRDNKTMYYNDSPTRKVVAFVFDLETGAIGNETVIFNFDDYSILGIPDGMTIDMYGNLWMATFDKTILNVNPRNGKLISQIELPVDQVTSVMWGDRFLDTLYVTTANLNVTNPIHLSGSLFKITGLRTKGVPENQFLFPEAPTY